MRLEIRPPPSTTTTIAAAMSHGLSPRSQNPSVRPTPTFAMANAADPARLTACAARMKRENGPRLFFSGSLSVATSYPKPVAMRARSRESTSVTRRWRPFNVAPPPRRAAYRSSSKGL